MYGIVRFRRGTGVVFEYEDVRFCTGAGSVSMYGFVRGTVSPTSAECTV